MKPQSDLTHPSYKSLLMENNDIIVAQIQLADDNRYIKIIEPRLFKSSIIMSQVGPTESRMMIPWMPMVGKNPVTIPIDTIVSMTDLDEMGIATYTSNLKAGELQQAIVKKAHQEFLDNVKKYEDAVEADPDPSRLGPNEQEFLEGLAGMAGENFAASRNEEDEYIDDQYDQNDEMEIEEPDFSTEFDTLGDIQIDSTNSQPDIVDRGPRFTFDE